MTRELDKRIGALLTTAPMQKLMLRGRYVELLSAAKAADTFDALPDEWQKFIRDCEAAPVGQVADSTFVQ